MKLSAAEYEIMECVWALGRPVSGMDIMRALDRKKGWKQPTVLTFLSRLVEKGLLETEKRGKLRSYTAAMTREAYKNARHGIFWHSSTAAAYKIWLRAWRTAAVSRLKNWRPCARG